MLFQLGFPCFVHPDHPEGHVDLHVLCYSFFCYRGEMKLPTRDVCSPITSRPLTLTVQCCTTTARLGMKDIELTRTSLLVENLPLPVSLQTHKWSGGLSLSTVLTIKQCLLCLRRVTHPAATTGDGVEQFFLFSFTSSAKCTGYLCHSRYGSHLFLMCWLESLLCTLCDFQKSLSGIKVIQHNYLSMQQ